MDLVLSRLSQLEGQTRLQASSLAQLKAENEAQQSSIARLSFLNDSKDVFIRQLEAKVFPEGFWIWEKVGDGLSGRWAWSKDKHRKPPPTNRIGPPTSLLSLPNELLEIILRLALPKQRDRIQPLSVCFRFLEVLSPIAYRTVELSSPSAAISFVLPRISDPNPSTSRINSLLSPQTLIVHHDAEEVTLTPTDFLPLTLVHRSDPRPILLPHLKIIEPFETSADALLNWSPLLRLLNPAKLSLLAGQERFLDQVPTTSRVHPFWLEGMVFLSTWSRLRSVVSLGGCTSLIVGSTTEGEEEEDASLFRNCFEKQRDGSIPELEMWLRTRYKDGRTEEELLDGLGLSRISENEDAPYYWDLPGDQVVEMRAVLKIKEDETE